MIRKTELEQAKAEAMKTVRTAVRLAHALRADRELNDVVPAAEAAFDLAINSGILPDPIEFIRALGAGDEDA